MSEFKIRKAAKQDEKELAPLVVESQLFRKMELEQEPVDESIFGKENRKTLESWITQSDKSYFIAVDANGGIRGFVLCMVDNPVSKTGSLSDLFVVPAFRGSGIAMALTNEALKWLKENGVKKVTLAVHKKNVSALKVYEKAGFLPKDDDYLLMVKDI